MPADSASDDCAVSWHPGGALFGYVDGSVHFLTENLDLRLFWLLGDRLDGEVMGETRKSMVARSSRCRPVSSARNWVSIVGCGALLLLLGCRPSPYPLAPARGSVTIDGQPLAHAKVMFSPVSQGPSMESGRSAMVGCKPMAALRCRRTRERRRHCGRAHGDGDLSGKTA